MYNRYIRNENGEHTRIPQTASPQIPPDSSDHSSSHQKSTEQSTSASPPPKHEKRRSSDSLTNLLQQILDRLHLDHVDTGDLMLLALLFFLFQEKADEELLIALGLLLIL